MIAYFPELYPDELVYSWFCRYYVHAGCLNYKMALSELLNKRCNNPNKEFIGQLNPCAREKISELYPMEEIVLNHTMFPQYARFIPLQDKKKALKTLCDNNCDAHHLFAILPRSGDEQYLRYCPLCAKEDREAYGEAYWHRKHQIRNKRMCVKHNCMLKKSTVTAKSEKCFNLCPAEYYVDEIMSEPHEMLHSDTSMLQFDTTTLRNEAMTFQNDTMMLQFETYVENIFEATIDFTNQVPLSSILYHQMKKTKYMKSTGICRYTKLFVDDMGEFYKRMKLCNNASIHQVQRILLGSGFEFSATCQIAFFLGVPVKELTESALTRGDIQEEEESHYMKSKESVDWEELDNETSVVLEQIAKGIYNGTASDTGRPERVSEKGVYREMGLKSHSLENMPKCRGIFEKYTESYPESWARKIIWAYKKLNNERGDDAFYWSDIRLLAGVKKDRFKKCEPYLTKHTDVYTVMKITEMVNR